MYATILILWISSSCPFPVFFMVHSDLGHPEIHVRGDSSRLRRLWEPWTLSVYHWFLQSHTQTCMYAHVHIWPFPLLRSRGPESPGPGTHPRWLGGKPSLWAIHACWWHITTGMPSFIITLLASPPSGPYSPRHVLPGPEDSPQLCSSLCPPGPHCPLLTTAGLLSASDPLFNHYFLSFFGGSYYGSQLIKYFIQFTRLSVCKENAHMHIVTYLLNRKWGNKLQHEFLDHSQFFRTSN